MINKAAFKKKRFISLKLYINKFFKPKFAKKENAYEHNQIGKPPNNHPGVSEVGGVFQVLVSCLNDN